MNDERTPTGARPDPTELLLEAATTAHREREPATGRILPAPAWWDLSAAERLELFDRQMESRQLERGLDRRGLSSTALAVIERLPNVPQLGG